MAMCYQKLGILEECALCLEACLASLETEFMQDYFNSNRSNPSLRLKLLKYQCKTRMQICALLSQSHKHKEAMVHAKWGVKISHFLVKDLLSQTEYYAGQVLNGQSVEEANILKNIKYSMLEKTAIKLVPVLRAVAGKMAHE